MSHVLGIVEKIPSSILGNRHGPSGKNENLKSLQSFGSSFNSMVFPKFLGDFW